MIFPKSWHNQIKGQAMVEAAFVLFILVLLTFGITEFGRAMYTKNTLNNAARAGARCAIVRLPSGCNSTPTTPCWDGSDIAVITQCVRSAISAIVNPANVTVTVFLNGVDVTGGSTAGHPVSGDTVTV